MGGAAIEAVQLLFLNIAMLVMVPISVVMLPAATAARWPHTKIVGSLFALSFVIIVLSLDLPIGAHIVADVTQRPFAAEWVNAVAIAGIQAGVLTLGIAVSWFYLLSRLYPLDPSTPVRIRLRDLFGLSFSIAVTSGYTAYAVAYWISPVPVTLTVTVAVALVAFVMAIGILSWVLRRYWY